MKYFRLSVIYTIVSLFIAGLWGWYSGHTLESLLAAVGSSLILGVLEVSFSFDNAVMNATVLEKMSSIWKTIFLTVGIAIAVFGMRFLFPIVVVWSSTTMSFSQVVAEAFDDPTSYATYLKAAHPMIAAFGSTFLMCIFVNWAFEEKEDKWLKWPESFLEFVGSKIGPFKYTLAYLSVALFTYPSVYHHRFDHGPFICLVALVLYAGVKFISDLLANNKDTVKAGIGLFLYLELMDASFSFDGVMGAFAITQNIVLIMLGLGIGAMFVRSMTIMLVETGSLKEYPYLGHGANWAIGTLAFLVALSIQVSIPEWVTGLSGAVLILASAFTKKKES